MKAAAIILLLFAGQAAAFDVETMHRPQSLGGPLEVTAGEALVRFDPALPPASQDSLLHSAGLQRLKDLPFGGWTVVKLPPGLSVASGLDSLRAKAGVLAAEPNRVYRPVKASNDPSASSQYHLSRINAFGSWEYEVGDSSSVTIVIVDTGIQGDHPDLQSKIIAGVNRFFDPNSQGASSAANPPTDACGHGTAVAGTAAAATNNGVGVAGVTWGARLVSLKVFEDTNCLTNDVAVAAAINYTTTTLRNVAGVGRIIVNMSLGGSGACSTLLGPVTADAVNNYNIPFTVAAGNSGGGVLTPANCPAVIPVGATDQSDNVAGFSCRGPELASQGVVAPGVGILTTALGSGYASVNGTSFSAPITAGIIALVFAKKPLTTAAEAKTIIRGSAEGIGIAGLSGAQYFKTQGNLSGAGRVNSFLAMRLAVEGTLATFEGKKRAIAFPNPFRPAVTGTVSITVPDDLAGTNPEIKIYTVDGALVRELPGQTWDGRNDAGKPVASGTYVFLVKTGKGKTTGKVTLIR